MSAIIRSPDSFNSNFGICVALDETTNTILISANAQSEYELVRINPPLFLFFDLFLDAFTGKVYVYSLNSYNVWILTGTIESPLGTFKSFGFQLALSGDYAIIGSANGYAFIYERSNDIWTLVKTLQPSNAGDTFGHAVAIDGTYAVIGAPGYQQTAGSVYIYNRVSAATWVLSETLSSVAGYNSQFGYSVAIHNSTIAVGAPGFIPGVFGSQGIQTANSTGWVYCYDFDSSTQS